MRISDWSSDVCSSDLSISLPQNERADSMSAFCFCRRCMSHPESSVFTDVDRGARLVYLLPSNTTAEKNLNALLPTQSPAAPDVSADTETFATTVVVRKPYLLFLGEATHFSQAKTAFGLRDWAPEACVGQWRDRTG